MHRSFGSLSPSLLLLLPLLTRAHTCICVSVTACVTSCREAVVVSLAAHASQHLLQHLSTGDCQTATTREGGRCIRLTSLQVIATLVVTSSLLPPTAAAESPGSQRHLIILAFLHPQSLGQVSLTRDLERVSDSANSSRSEEVACVFCCRRRRGAEHIEE